MLRSPLLSLLAIAPLACGDEHGEPPEVSATSRLAIGGGHACRLSRAAEVQCWSWLAQQEHEVGRADILVAPPVPPVELGEGARPYAIAAGADHTCVVLATGGLKCWGHNERGQLGLGDTRSRGADPADMGDALPLVDLGDDATVDQVSCGFAHCCALLDDHRVKCWGANEYGQLGLGDTDDRGDEPGEMGDALPAVDLGSDDVVVAISSGGVHNCVLFESGAAKCWGLSEWGRLGYLGASDDSPGDEPGEMGDSLPIVDTGRTIPIVEISAGNRHTCARFEPGDVKCWGKNADDACDDQEDIWPCGVDLDHVGRLGTGDDFDRWTGDGTPPVDLGADVRAEQVKAGYLHTCALVEGGRVKCWGANDFGQLGIGDANDRGGEPEHLGDALPFVDLGTDLQAVEIGTALYHTCALLSDDRVKCWGQHFGGTRPEDLGDALPFVEL